LWGVSALTAEFKTREEEEEGRGTRERGETVPEIVACLSCGGAAAEQATTARSRTAAAAAAVAPIGIAEKAVFRYSWQPGTDASSLEACAN
jgi:hypothetical protein